MTMSCEFDCCYMKHLSSLITPYPLFISSYNPSYRRQAMIDEFDLDGDGEINEAEFFAIMTDET